MRNPIAVLKSLTDKSKDASYKFKRLYRNLYNPEFYWLAYKNIYANKGSMTPGVDGRTIDNMSDSRIQKIIASLKDGSYKPHPARRKYIPKKNSKKKRPLGIPCANDKLVQEVVRMILESICEQNFSKCSHGFRPHKSCHTALKQIHDTFTSVRWFVEGDIEACFDSFDHHVLIDLLRKRIDDESFMALMWKFLKAGYMENWQHHRTYGGTPQGSGVSPIFTNIYLNELDKYIQEYKIIFDVGNPKTRKFTTEYNIARHKVERYKLKNKQCWTELTSVEKETRAKTLKQFQRDMRSISPYVVADAGYKSIQYVRYADDFIIGVIGSKEDAQKVKSEVKKFLANKLNLKLSEEKTKITHTSERARFLGYDITVSRAQNAKKLKNGRTQRCHSYVVELLVPREKWVGKLLEYKAMKIVLTENGRERYKTLHRGRLINKKDEEILYAYNAEIRGLYNYYSIANDSYKIGVFANAMKYSMFKTFANKYKTSVRKIKDRFFKNGEFTMEYHTSSGRKQAAFYNKGFKRRLEPMTDAVITLPQYKKYDKPNSLRERIKTGCCELCGEKSNDIVFHQVAKLKDLTGNSDWETIMRKRRRKTLVVCPSCHGEIHNS